MKIEIKDLTFNCIIGILAFERKKEQRVVVSCSFKYDFKKQDFIDYSKVASKIESIMKKKKFLLIEDALLYIEKKLLKKFKIIKLSLKISKPDILKNTIVSVSL